MIAAAQQVIRQVYQVTTRPLDASVDVNWFKQVHEKRADFAVPAQRHHREGESLVHLYRLPEPARGVLGRHRVLSLQEDRARWCSTSRTPQAIRRGCAAGGDRAATIGRRAPTKSGSSVGTVDMVPGRLLIFPSEYFHAAYHPQNSFFEFPRLDPRVLDGRFEGRSRMDPRLRQASPIVVIGMHRSGTRLLVDVLDRLGVFMGADRQGDAESVGFMLINEGDPAAVRRVLVRADVRAFPALAAQRRRAACGERRGRRSKHSSSSTRARRAGTARPRRSGRRSAGRTRATRSRCRFGSGVFPSLRVIHIVRHGVDVAASLARRHAQALRAASGEAVLRRSRSFATTCSASCRRAAVGRCAEALTMWEQYVEKARQESAALGERALEIRFEDLLAQPESVVPCHRQVLRRRRLRRNQRELLGRPRGRPSVRVPPRSQARRLRRRRARRPRALRLLS